MGQKYDTIKDTIDREHEMKMEDIALQNLKDEYKEVEQKARYKKQKKFTTSKILMAALVFIAFEIIIFAEYMMFKTNDLNALYALIGISATLTAGFWAYEHKSKAENLLKIQQSNMDTEEEQSEG